MKKIILFELNEVPLRIVKYFRDARPDSTIARIFPRARKFETFTEDKGHLSPWVTWPTFHRGVPNTKHYIQEFGQGLEDVDAEFPPVWKILAENNLRVGLFGSLHSYPPPRDFNNYAFYVPDVFASGAECFPKSLEAFQEFNLRMSRDSARNVSRRIPFHETAGLLAKFNELGFRPRTVADIGRQLIEERVDKWKVVRRRTYQTVLAFDVFYRQLFSRRPDFSTFFTNHVASSLHRYWAAVFPEDYDELGFDQVWLNTFNKEILFTMSKADEMLGRLVNFVDANPDFQLLVATSMGQQATLAKPVETQLCVADPSRFMKALGVSSELWSPKPAMIPQFNVQVAPQIAEGVAETLDLLCINGRQVNYSRRSDGFFSITLGQPNLTEIDVRLRNASVALAEIGLSNLEILDKSGATAYHIPEGALFVYDAHAQDVDPTITKISTIDVCPQILSNYGVRIPQHMGGRAYSLW
jgi:hypothetical protein